MRPILFRVFGVPVHSYPAMLYVGLVLGMVSGNYAAHVAGLDAFRTFVASCLLAIPAVGGARVLYVVVHWKFFRANPSRIWDLSEGGMAQYGGILLAVPLSVPLLAALELPFGKFWDVGSFTILTGMIFTRFGCLMNGCCSGRASATWWGMNLPNREGTWKKRIPTQLLEACWAAVLLVTAASIWKGLAFDGALFVFVAAGYAFGRLAMESMRDHQGTAGKFNVQHAISLLIIALSMFALAGSKLI